MRPTARRSSKRLKTRIAGNIKGEMSNKELEWVIWNRRKGRGSRRIQSLNLSPPNIIFPGVGLGKTVFGGPHLPAAECSYSTMMDAQHLNKELSRFRYKNTPRGANTGMSIRICKMEGKPVTTELHIGDSTV